MVIPTHNAKSLIGEQLEALAQQDYPGNYEVIVSDNGSTDGLADYINSHVLSEKLNLRCIDSSGIQGASHARNIAVTHSASEFLAFCDADDRVHPSWLSQMLLVAADADLVSGRVETATINSAEVCSWRPTLDSDSPAETSFLTTVTGCNLGMWRRTFDAVDGFDESMTGAGEDIDFAWRVQLAGLTVRYAPEAVVAYRLRTTYAQTWRQMTGYGRAEVELYHAYRHYGAKRPKIKNTLLVLTALIILNPAIPTRLTKMPRGRWLVIASLQTGRIQGSVAHRVLFI